MRQWTRFITYFYIFSAPLYYFRLWGVNIVPTDFIGILLMLAYLREKLLHSHARIHKYQLLLLPIGLLAIISSWYAQYPIESLENGALFIWLVLCSTMIYDLANSANDTERFLHMSILILLFGGFLMTAFIFGINFLQDGIRVFRLSYSYDHRTQLPYLMGSLSMLSFALLMRFEQYNWTLRLVLFIYYQMMVFLTIISISRGPWLVLASILGVFAISSKTARYRIFQTNFPGLVLSASVIIYYDQVDRLVVRLQSIIDLNHSETSTRTEIYRHAVGVISENPIFGIGFNNYSAVYDIAGGAHSTYLEIGSELGVGALSLYLLFVILITHSWFATLPELYKENPKKIKKYSAVLFSGIVFLLVGQMFTVATLWFRYFWVLLGLGLVGIGSTLSKDK